MKILIAYATKSGTTRICAEKLAALLPQHEVSLADISVNSDLRPKDFDFTVVGGPIRMGKLHKAAKKFIESSTFEPSRSAFFICCGLDTNAGEYFKKNFPAPLLENALAYTLLGGELKPDKQSKLDRFLLKAFIEANRENEDFVMPTIYTEEIGRLADKIKAHIG